MKVAQSELISVSIIRKVSLKLSLNLYSCCSVLLMHINRCVIEHYLCLHLITQRFVETRTSKYLKEK